MSEGNIDSGSPQKPKLPRATNMLRRSMTRVVFGFLAESLPTSSRYKLVPGGKGIVQRKRLREDDPTLTGSKSR